MCSHSAQNDGVKIPVSIYFINGLLILGKTLILSSSVNGIHFASDVIDGSSGFISVLEGVVGGTSLFK